MTMSTSQGTSKLLIRQADNYAVNFGEVLRSSAILWVKNNNKVRTTISFSNYWKFKNFIDVNVVLNLRKITGELINRQIISFEEKAVWNYSPPNDFEGSVEIETFSIKNMRIPYAAVMAVYESAESISMVHSYARAYSQHEIEDNRTISVGEESCWTLRDDNDTTSFAVIHNGSIVQECQSAKLSIRNSEGNELVCEVKLPKLAPFETKIIEPKKYFVNLLEYLGNKPGNARISFKLNGGFTRMLCGVEKNDGSQLQVTHSNFDYSAHKTDVIKEGILRAYMRTPNVSGSFKQEVVVYPDTDKGEYISKVNQEERGFRTGQIHNILFGNNGAQVIEFSRTDNILPTRIVTGLRLNATRAIIPSECSLGVVHHNRPKKHFHWMIVSEGFHSKICWVDFQEVYGGCPVDAEFVFKLYKSNCADEISKNFKKLDLPQSNLICLNEIFDNACLAEDFCYVTIWCSYGGLMFFSTMEKKGSITIEHSF